jgi:hypothetical protein
MAWGVRGERLLHRLLEQGLQVDGWGGRLGCRGGRSCWGRLRRLALLAQGVEQRLPLPRLVQNVLGVSPK